MSAINMRKPFRVHAALPVDHKNKIEVEKPSHFNTVRVRWLYFRLP